MDTSNRLARVTQAIFVAQRERALSSVDAVLETYRSRRFLVSFPSAWIIALGQGHLAECHQRVGEAPPITQLPKDLQTLVAIRPGRWIVLEGSPSRNRPRHWKAILDRRAPPS